MTPSRMTPSKRTIRKAAEAELLVMFALADADHQQTESVFSMQTKHLVMPNGKTLMVSVQVFTGLTVFIVGPDVQATVGQTITQSISEAAEAVAVAGFKTRTMRPVVIPEWEAMIAAELGATINPVEQVEQPAESWATMRPDESFEEWWQRRYGKIENQPALF